MEGRERMGRFRGEGRFGVEGRRGRVGEWKWDVWSGGEGRGRVGLE